MEKKKIMVIGWDKSLNNMGDIILIDATSWLIQQAGSFDVSRMDFYVPQWSIPFKVFDKIWQVLLEASDKYFGWRNDTKGKIHYYLKDIWYTLLLDSYYKSNLNGYDAVITSGGGTLKYQTQDHSYFTEHLVKIANQKKIPVMINAAGIEGVDTEDIRFIRLSQRLNNSTVKCVTTRDDISSLRKLYISNSGIDVDMVADPAYWIPEVYCTEKSNTSECIGINLVRDNIFSDYDRVGLSNENLYKLYESIIEQLTYKGYKWKLFANGIDKDYEFGRNLCSRLGLSLTEKILPVARTTKEYVEQVSSFKAVIGGRMHATITSYVLNIPVAAFVWSVKMRYFADYANIGEYFLEGADINAIALVYAMERAIIEAQDRSENIRKEQKYGTLNNIKAFLEKL